MSRRSISTRSQTEWPVDWYRPGTVADDPVSASLAAPTFTTTSHPVLMAYSLPMDPSRSSLTHSEAEEKGLVASRSNEMVMGPGNRTDNGGGSGGRSDMSSTPFRFSFFESLFLVHHGRRCTRRCRRRL